MQQKKRANDGAQYMKSQPHSFAGTILKQAKDNTLGPDNGGVSGQPYLTRRRWGWQLPGPFTSVACEWAFSTGPTSLARAQALLLRFTAVAICLVVTVI